MVACGHVHPSLGDADLCAKTRLAQMIAIERPTRTIYISAPSAEIRRQRRIAVRVAEAIAFTARTATTQVIE